MEVYVIVLFTIMTISMLICGFGFCCLIIDALTTSNTALNTEPVEQPIASSPLSPMFRIQPRRIDITSEETELRVFLPSSPNLNPIGFENLFTRISGGGEEDDPPSYAQAMEMSK